jgi:DNA-binding CsgD family transcriptional regulator
MAVGATADGCRVDARLGRLRNGRDQGRPLTGWGSLTETERRVARVVAEGLSNPAVGERMFLSRHTVDFHLRQIFRKLAIHSRVELTRYVLEHDGGAARRSVLRV